MITEELMQPGRWDLSLSPLTPIAIRQAIVERGHIIITQTAFGTEGIVDQDYKDASIYTGRVDRVGDLGIPGESPMSIGGAHISVWLGDSDGRGDVLDTTQSFSAATWSAFIAAIRPQSIAAGTVTNNPTAVTSDFFALTPKGCLDYQCPISGAEWKVTDDGKLDSGTQADLFVTTPEVLAAHRSLNQEALIKARHSPNIGVSIDASKWVSKVHLAGTVEAAAGGEDIIMASADLTDISESNPYKDFQGNADNTAVLVNNPVAFVSQAQAAAEAALTELYNIDELITLDLSNFNVSADFEVGDTIYVYHPPRIVDDTNQLVWMGGVAFPKAIRVFAMTWPVRRGMGVYYRDKDGNYTDLSPYVDEVGEATIDVGVQRTSPIGSARGVAQAALNAINQPAQVFYIAEKAASALPSTYPEGRSMMAISTDTTWPLGSTDGLVETWITGAGAAGYRGRQVYTEVNGHYTFHRFMSGTDTWGNWQLLSPKLTGSGTGTAYNIVTADTWETAYSLTDSAFPTSSFGARINAAVSAWARSPNAGQLAHRIQCEISRDGGSTWTSGRPQIGTQYSAASTFVPLMAHATSGGGVTGTIQVRIRVYSSVNDTDFDDLQITATIAGNP